MFDNLALSTSTLFRAFFACQQTNQAIVIKSKLSTDGCRSTADQ